MAKNVMDVLELLRKQAQGAGLTSDAGLLACRELDDALGLTETAEESRAVVTFSTDWWGFSSSAPGSSSSSAAINSVDGHDQSAADNKEHEGEDPDRVPPRIPSSTRPAPLLG